MPFDTFQALKVAFGLLSIGGGIWLTISTANDKKKINEMQKLFNESKKCNLNQTSIRKQRQASRQHSNSILGRPVCIQKVTAHFTDKNYPHVNFKANKNDDFAQVDCLPFYVVEKTFSKLEYELYQVQVKDTLVSQGVLMPDQGIFNPSESDASRRLVPYILTSASTLGIVGTLTLSSDSSDYVIDAKIIGMSMRQIEDHISSEMLYKTFELVAGGVLIIVGIGWFIKMYRDNRKAWVPLQASLLR